MLQRSPRAAGLVEPCLPSPAKSPPSGRDWLHEIKHDGFRILARRDAKGVRLYTRNGHAPLFPCDASHRQSRAGNG
jgi:ATP-dependent DNA ligase